MKSKTMIVFRALIHVKPRLRRVEMLRFCHLFCLSHTSFAQYWNVVESLHFSGKLPLPCEWWCILRPKGQGHCERKRKSLRQKWVTFLSNQERHDHHRMHFNRKNANFSIVCFLKNRPLLIVQKRSAIFSI